ncbi:hypothetical protein [Chitinimonas koreensis]|uniref:hypothetical protein n=1 Tax=Chitinimonas koreensis TaxID=356302 RepID=UPI0012F9E0C4|nr:hypothetical protein [Chitinimonas koreensis]QNM98403.1 hypothetical protein H9L41_09300 [Chitinimonas koreensis]
MKKLIVLLLSLVPFAAHAAEQDIAVSNFQVWGNVGANNVVRVTTPGTTVANPSGCSDTDSYMVASTLPKDAQARIFAILVVARSAGAAVTLRISGCENNRPAIQTAYY